MASRRSRQFTSEAWNGFWGTDARYYARRSDGACFAIDGEAKILDLAAATPASGHVRAVPTLPTVGRYVLQLFATQPIGDGWIEPIDETSAAPAPSKQSSRLFAYGVRRLA
jgi:hypothetical protein